DLKDTGSTIALDKSAATIVVTAPSDFIGKQVIDVLSTKLIRREIDLKALAWGAMEAATGGTIRISCSIVNGIESELAKRINKDIRDEKFKVKVQIEGEKLRVSSASRDALQDAIAFLRQKDYGIPLQYTNYR
ncbi:MAG: DUF520 family protein, partial [Coriobacteriia bacterium]|nr:DUF520 family protein [Coriobacteriia bacterium]